MLELGLVGKPNTGKTTFFNAVTLANAPVAGYPFTTIDANVGVTYVRSKCPCREFNVVCNPQNSKCINGVRHVPVRIIDVAGLVEGAHMGRGLGNRFLDNLRMAAALIHIIDASGATDAEGRPCPPGTHDPLKDIDFLEVEIAMWIRGLLAKDWPKFARRAKYEKLDLVKEITNRLSGLGVKHGHVYGAFKLAALDQSNPEKWTADDLLRFVAELRKVSKPIMIAANKADVSTADENIARLRKRGYIVVPTCAEAELVLRRAAEKGIVEYHPGDSEFKLLKPELLNEQQKMALEKISALLKKFGSTGVQQVVDRAVYELLNLIVVYPVDDEHKLTDKNGNVLPDAFLVRKGTTAREFAYTIHTDLGEAFLYAIDARTKRRLGEDYELKDRDIIKIVSSRGR
ncbi:MAG: redox-regulated ATPase YchF [Candidatus Hadarchaeum sp.]|uniref:redox-regulated ATPase YchF n=1 Tax=Candidatus Hadarchaeum sp. TaxID=2883567 RepID=UPI003D0B66B1